MAKFLNAQAFTKGKNIVLGAGQPQASQSHNSKLLAHELAHVVQQSSGNSPVRGMAQRKTVAEPRALDQTLDISRLSESELRKEAGLIRQWLAKHPESSAENESLKKQLGRIVNELRKRKPPMSLAPVVAPPTPFVLDSVDTEDAAVSYQEQKSF